MFKIQIDKYFGLFKSQTSAKNKFEHLDGLRGLLALIVLLHHFPILKPPEKIYRLFVGLGSYVGVTGFFVLSAFLLTYRLIIDFERAQNNRICILKVIQYVLRRFFRIYVVFFLFLIIHYNFPRSIQPGYRPTIRFTNAIMLDGRIGAHLWTVPIEIKYYFCIPPISFVVYKSGKYWYLLAFAILSVIGVLEYVYPEPGLIPTIRCVNIFLKGSLLGIFYYNLKKNEHASKFIAKCSIQASITPILAFITLIQFKYFSYYFNPKINLTLRNVSSSIMFIEIGLLLISEQPNVFTRFLNIDFLKSCGKYSFGIYLFHYMVLNLLNTVMYIFAGSLDRLFGVIVMTYGIGFLWFYLVENPLMTFANKLCKKCEQLKYFRMTNEDVQTL